MPAPRNYPLELRERAVRMYRTAEPKPVIRRMAEELGVHHEALRNWIRQAEADAGERDDLLTTEEKNELAQLRREVRDLRRANEILRAALNVNGPSAQLRATPVQGNAPTQVASGRSSRCPRPHHHAAAVVACSDGRHRQRG